MAEGWECVGAKVTVSLDEVGEARVGWQLQQTLGRPGSRKKESQFKSGRTRTISYCQLPDVSCPQNLENFAAMSRERNVPTE